MTIIRVRHKAADAMDWNEAMQLVDRMFEQGEYRNALLVAAGCYLGLRISDLLRLRWADILSEEFILEEQKTGKVRTLRVNSFLQRFAASCRKQMGNPPVEDYIFVSERGGKPISRQAVDVMLKKVKYRYRVRSAKVFSSHTLRKTFGRRVSGCRSARRDAVLRLFCYCAMCLITLPCRSQSGIWEYGRKRYCPYMMP